MTEAPERQKSHKDFARQQVTGAIGQICDAWPDAIAASAARGYGSGGSGGRQPQGDHSDPTFNLSLREDVAGVWLREARPTLGLIAQFSTKSWVGGFKPAEIKDELQQAGENLVDIWPMNIRGLLNKLYRLADTALAEWPPTPEKGTKIDDVIVGERSKTGDICAKCEKYVSGGVADPIRRLDGKPYHLRPCWEAARKKAQRAK